MLGRKKQEEQTLEKLLGREIKEPQILQPEKEVSKEELEQLRESAKPEQPPSKKTTPPPPSEPTRPKTITGAIRTEDVTAIENILEEDIAPLYQSLPADLKPKFKQKGEATAIAIADLLNQTKVRVKKIISLIKEWLKLVPGINRYFLEQEAKIKADKIMGLRGK
ncbi:MAG: hypothetical protein COT81_05800 [Candidatus Buchananbacteria bacterium CG10_big_fil_rev_8_21_14_0_10_42_9]|uniref:Uncharacterized protein n=1 Tax=Candidatus Buchananbacteria bacterium CG10_big_fil_rev_8_21_14_0_10_42_9 TaxID=1974526 RepID=A0A2H0VZQ4_9BACT|nr:MAG: hypothetical protein COT81_05800 [Candidatus Buchananbacteria bacterium CG10_big_fil_rev_8_21_14_0_10_42_9]